jgi:phosphatidylinositol-3-phosphatase
MSGRPSWLERWRRLRGLRVAGTQLVVLGAVSLSSTGLIVAAALADGGSGPALAALAQRGVVVHQAPAAATPATTPASDTATPSVAAPAPRKSSGTPAAAGTTTSSSDSSASQAPSGGGGGEATTTPTTPTATTPATTTPTATGPTPSKIKHVFVIALESDGYDATFGTAAASSYLVHDLLPKGALLSQLHTLDDADLPNGIALVSGQPPNPQTQQNCPTYADFPAASKPGSDGALAGAGCVYPVTTLSLADQVGSAGRSWRAYVQGTGEAKSCRRPASGAADATLTPSPSDPYATRHNPFVYFHSLLDLGDCTTNDVDLTKLDGDLSKVASTPALAFIAPDLCHDGSSDPCAAGQPGGTAASDAFLAEWVPKILASPAYKQDGLLVVTFDGVRAAAAGTPAPADPRRVGALLVSRWTKPGATDATSGDPYALLRTIEDLLGLAHLARAGASGVHSYADVALGSSG